ncbi:hypothetical protein ACIA8O_07840 [Kitasatospora sp. NPDC051853]|uniref:hypothetical protein n=1 Tax=Kitasatospora sp. NPDC051853 TaxID=3364058 RepID=UPI00378F981B
MHVYRRQCDQTVRAFTVALLVLLPVSYLALFEIERELPLGDAGMVVFGLLPLLVLPFAMGAQQWALHGRAGLRWAGRTARRYVTYWLAPSAAVYLIVLAGHVPGLRYGGADFLGLTALWMLALGVPMVVALLMVAPWAHRATGRRKAAARAALIVLSNLVLVPTFALGGGTALLLLAIQVAFACRAVPGPAAKS